MRHGSASRRSTFTGLAVFLLLGAAGCAPDEDEGTSEQAAAAAELSSEQIDSLKEEVPQLREERAPPPRASGDAAPDQVPARLASALPERVLETVTGEATFYADKFEGRRTASGIPFRQNQMVAAHRAYPFGTVLRVTNTGNDRSVNVRVVDRGPFGGSAKVRRTVIDLSRRAAEQLGYTRAGRTTVRVEVLEWGDGLPRVS